MCVRKHRSLRAVDRAHPSKQIIVARECGHGGVCAFLGVRERMSIAPSKSSGLVAVCNVSHVEQALPLGYGVAVGWFLGSLGGGLAAGHRGRLREVL